MKHSITTDDGFQKAAKYSHSTVDYLGLVSWSIVTRCSNAAKDSFLRITRPVAKNAVEPFVCAKQKTRQLLSRKAYDSERIKKTEERILQLEKRLAMLEKHGVRLSRKGVQTEEKTAIDEETRAILHMIVEDNKRLKALLK